MKLKLSAPIDTLGELHKIIAAMPDATSQDVVPQESGGLKMTAKDWGDLLVTCKDFAEFMAALIALHTALREAGKPKTSIAASTPATYANVNVGGDATPASIEADIRPLRGAS